MRLLITGGSGFIGTNLIEHLRPHCQALLSVDSSPPKIKAHESLYQKINLLDADGLKNIFQKFKPTHVVHLAARTDLAEGEMEKLFAANTKGTANIINAIEAAGSVQRCIFASSKFVCRNGYTPKSDEDYCPHTTYGESKVQMEKIIRRHAPKNFEWCIVRPTSIWGPWFGVPYRDFFLAVAKGRYFNLGKVDLPRSYGYIKNTVYQLVTLLNAEKESIQGQTFYLLDYEDYFINPWARLIADRMGKGKILTVPEIVVRSIALAGDILKRVGYSNPPMSSFRLDNMRTKTAGLPYENIKKLTGPLPYDNPTGVDETVKWMLEQKLIN
jgi:GlcNAc-P-P-Und epimerase